MKRCTRCDELKPSADFHRRADQADGLSTWCRPCCSEHSRAVYAAKEWRPAAVQLKACSKCKATKPAGEFSRSKRTKDGLQSWCLGCNRIKQSERVGRLRERPVVAVPSEKLCPTCDSLKSSGDFYRNRLAIDGLTYQCKECVKARRRGVPRSPTRRAQDAAYYEANRERIKGRVAEWARANPERIGDYGRRRRARKRGVEPVATRDERAALFESYCGLCAYCHAPADTLDHIDPLFHGGADVLDNLVPACRSCNGRKHTRPLLRWLMDMAA